MQIVDCVLALMSRFICFIYTIEIVQLLTGYTELELPETRRRMKDSSFVNVYPFLFNEYERSGYVTSFNEDLPDFGTFSYRLNGFNEQPTTHYMRPFYLALQQELFRHKRLCVGDTPRHQVMLDYTAKVSWPTLMENEEKESNEHLPSLTKAIARSNASDSQDTNISRHCTFQIMQAYANKKPIFTFSFHGELSHDSINLIGTADNDLTQWLQNLQSSLLNNTVLILMSDHGNRYSLRCSPASARTTFSGILPIYAKYITCSCWNRFAEVRNTLQGKLEERLPFFSFIFPERFKQRHPQQYAKFRENIGRLSTPFDVHQTLLDILDTQTADTLPDKPASDKNGNNATASMRLHARKLNRAISLLQTIPENRTCAEAYIEPHWCSCLGLNAVNTTAASVKRAADAVVDAINEFTKDERTICHALQLANVTWAGTLQYRQNLLKFKTNRDLDGYLADLTAPSMESTEHLYQLQLYTVPGSALFEASLTHNLLADQFAIDIRHVSRINEYGSQAACILSKNPDLRKFCYCR